MARTLEEKKAERAERRQARKEDRQATRAAAKERASRFAAASPKGNQGGIGIRDIKAVMEKENMSEQQVYKQIANEAPDAKMGGYVAYKAGREGADPGITDISEYNGSMIAPTKHRDKGKVENHYAVGDIRYLRDKGYSLDEIGKHLSEQEDATFGARAQKLLDRYTAGLKNPPPETPGPTTPTPTPDPTPTPTPTPTPDPTTPVTPEVPAPVSPPTGGTGGNTFTDSFNPNAEAESSAEANLDNNSGNIDGDITIGDIDNTGGYIGQIGHTNNSVTINSNQANSSANANASNGGGGAASPLDGFLDGSNWSGPDNDPLANLMGGMAYQALNTNAWHRSQSDLNGRDAAARASALNDTLTKSREISAGYGQRAALGTERMFKLADKTWADTMGDTWRYQPPSWTQPKDPEPIESNTDKYFEEAMSQMGG